MPYAEAPTRPGLEGTVDKMALIDAMANRYASDRDFQELLLSKVLAGSGSATDDQILAIQKFVDSLVYRREIGEILRSPTETAKWGGDCDDLVVLTLAAARAVGIPAEPEVIANADGVGFHVRALLAFPPLRPQYYVVVDPVYRSEPEWAMAGRDLESSAARFPSVLRISRDSGTSLWPTVLLTAVITWIVARRWR